MRLYISSDLVPPQAAFLCGHASPRDAQELSAPRRSLLFESNISHCKLREEAPIVSHHKITTSTNTKIEGAVRAEYEYHPQAIGRSEPPSQNVFSCIAMSGAAACELNYGSSMCFLLEQVTHAYGIQLERNYASKMTQQARRGPAFPFIFEAELFPWP